MPFDGRAFFEGLVYHLPELDAVHPLFREHEKAVLDLPAHYHHFHLVADGDGGRPRFVEKFAQGDPAFRLETHVDDNGIAVYVEHPALYDIPFLKVSHRGFIEFLHLLLGSVFLCAGIDRLYHAFPLKIFYTPLHFVYYCFGGRCSPRYSYLLHAREPFGP